MRIHTLLPAILSLAALPAYGTTVYTSEAAYLAHPGFASFQSILVSGLIGYNGDTVGPVSGVTFSGVSSNALTVAPSPSGWPTGGVVQNVNNGERIDVTLPGGITGFGAYFGQQGAALNSSMTVTYAGGSQVFTPSAVNLPAYIGIAFDLPVSSFSIGFTNVSSLNKKINIGDLTIASPPAAAETPEAATYLTLGLGLILLPVLKRKLRVPPKRAVST